MNARPFTSHRAFGAYEVLEPLGAGGMGEVFRARDTRLGREVALKVLAEGLRLEPHRLARFEREARLLASLNHPNIGALHGIEHFDGVQALVLELVEGPTLAERLATGAIPPQQAIAIALQVAAALEAAHERGIVHRDLKPANIKLRADGTVKLLDFGLAKALDPATAGSDPKGVTATMIELPGAVLGTPAYMSPEQARGVPVDQRADIWAFGCVLFEMLAGQPAFPGDHASDVIARVIERDVDFDALPAATPAGVRRVLRRCLAKDAQARLRDIGDARLELLEANASPGSLPVRDWIRHRWPLLTSAAVVAVAAAIPSVLLITRSSTPVEPAPVARFTLGVTAQRDIIADRGLAVSSDGSRFAYLSNGGLYMRSRDRLESTLVRHIPSVTASAPFFSPDGQWIGYADGQSLVKMPVAGGPAVKIADAGPAAIASWHGEDIIYVDMHGLFRVSAAGGEPQVLLATPGNVEQLMCPQLLPGGRAVMFTAIATRTHTPRNLGSTAIARVDVLDLETGQRRTVVHGAGRGKYLPSGHLVHVTNGKLYAIAFDLDRLETRGERVEVGPAQGVADMSVSDEGTLVYQSPQLPSLGVLVWVDRLGREEPLGAPLRAYLYPRLSPDGTRVALDAWIDDNRDIWMWNLRRRSLERFTVDPTGNPLVTWTPDGRSLVFGSDRLGITNMFKQAADGRGEPEHLLKSEWIQMPLTFAPDGRLLFSADVARRGRDIHALAMDGKVEALINSPANELNAQVSADGKWIAYDSDESGQFEVYVRPYPDASAGRWQISSGGGRQPLWSHDGRELYFRDYSGAMWAVPVARTREFSPGAAVKLFDNSDYAGGGGAGSAVTYDLSPDGRRFLMIKRPPAETADTTRQLTVVLNWFEELRRLAPGT
jgi:serine/threonine protein kinase/Tol biopolymer transport system component